MRYLFWLTTAFTFGMLLTSFTHYTSIGLDDEILTNGVVVRRYWRVRWPGNGAFFVGYGQHSRADLTAPSERFDPAAAFFSTGTPAYPEWQGRLFGIQSFVSLDEGRSERWIGVPAFYLPLCLALMFFVKRSVFHKPHFR